MDETEISPAPGTVGFERDLIHGALKVTQGGIRIGVIADGGSDWLNGDKPAHVEYRVRYAGPGVPTPDGPFPTPESAAAAIVQARQALGDWLIPGPDGLTGFDRAALAFEATSQAQAADGAREKGIAETFHGMHPTDFTAHIARLLREKRPAAQAANPAAVAALERRAARRRPRRAKTAPGERRSTRPAA